MEQTKKAIGYIRRSKDDGKGVSLFMQTQEIKRYAEQNNFDLTEIVADPDQSGKDLNRDGIQKVISIMKDIDAVICYRQDRLTRSATDAFFLSSLFGRNGIAFHTVTDHRVDVASADGEFLYGMKVLLDQRERKLIGERTACALKAKKSRMERYGEVPYGFRLLADGKLERHPDEERVILHIKEWRKSGESLRSIINRLDKAGIKSKKGQNWHPMTISRLLSAE